MKHTTNARIVSFVLALVMLLPLISIPVFAEEAEQVTYVTHSESFDGKKLSDTILESGRPKDSGIKEATLDAESHKDVFWMSATPAAAAEYYLVNTSSRTATAITDYTVTDGKLSGKAGSTVITNATINTSAYKTNTGTANMYVATGALADAYCGYVGGNTAAPAKLLHPKMEGEGDFIVFSFDLYLSSDFRSKNGLQGRAQALNANSANVNLELFMIQATSNVATFTKHGNGSDVYDTGATLTLGAWHTLTFMVNRSTKVVTAFADGQFAYQTGGTSGVAPIVIAANSIAMENGRLSAPSDMGGHVEVDNFRIANCAEDQIDPAFAKTLEKKYDFENATIGGVTTKAPTGASIAEAAKDSATHGDVLHILATPVPDAKYYLWTGNNDKWPIKNATVADGKISGKTDKGDVTNAELPTSDSDTSKTYTISGTTYKIVTGNYADAQGGAGNFSNPMAVKMPQAEFGSDLFTISFDLYLSADFFHTQGFASRIYALNTSGNVRVELFRIYMSGQNAVFGPHNNAKNVTGTTKTLAKDAWHKITLVVDRNTAVVSAYADNEFAFQAVAYKSNSDSFYQYTKGVDIFPLVPQVNNFQFENNRGSGNLNNKGFVDIDNLTINAADSGLSHNGVAYTFEDQTVDYAPFDGFASNPAVNTTVKDNYGSMAWNIPNAGNADKSPMPLSPCYSYAVDKTLVYEVDYFIEPGAKGQLQSQINSFTATQNGVIPTKDESSSSTLQIPNHGMSWLDLYQIKYTGDERATLFFENGGSVHPTLGKSLSLAVGRWNNIALVIDLVDGYYDLYLNGNLAVEDVPMYRGGKKLTDITVYANKFVVGKVNTRQAAYEGNVQVDNIRIHQGNRPTMGAENVEYYDFEDFKYAQGMKANFVANNGLHPSLLTIGSVNGDTALRLPMIAAASEDTWSLLRSDGREKKDNFIYDPATPEKGTLAGNEITLAPDEKGVYWYVVSETEKWRPVSSALAETAAGGANNCRATKLNHGHYSYQNTKTLLLEMDYFIEYGSDGSFEAQFETFYSNGEAKTYFNFFQVNTKTGALTDSKIPLSIGQWNNVKIVLDLVSGKFDVYINGQFSHNKDGGHKNLEVGYNASSMLSFAKIVRETSWASLNTGVFYIDDIRIAADAEADRVLATDMLMDIVEGASIRLKDADRTGIRFATKINEEALEAIKAYLGASSVEIGKRGTLIAPEAYYLTANAMTHEALEALPVSTPYADVAFGGEYFGGDAGVNLPAGNYMVGSLVNLKDYSRSFAAAGYVELLIDGESYYLYSDVVVRSAQKVAGAALADINASWTDAQREILSAFAAGSEGAEPEVSVLDGLNVMAIGDSLFYGAKETYGAKQWINLLGAKYRWNLTNLGIGGATITYNKDATYSNFSMYNALFNNPSAYCFGSTADSRFFNCGNPSGNAEDVDMILLQAGSNDYGKTVQAPLGTIGSENPAEFLGAWKLMVNKLLEIYPNATIVMMTAWENNDQERADGANAIEYTSSVVDLYEALYASNDKVVLINSGSPEVSGVYMRDSAFRAQYAYDAFHLNDEGMKLMANNMLPYLEEIAQTIKAAD